MSDHELFPECLLHLKDQAEPELSARGEPPTPPPYDGTVKWLGFDKFKRVIYGVQVDCFNIRDYLFADLIKLNIFTNIEKRIKKYEFSLWPGPWPLTDNLCGFEWALSESGEFVGGLEVCQRNEKDIIITTLHLTNIEDGSLKPYKVVTESNESEMQIPIAKESISWNLYHTEKLGWIVKHKFLTHDRLELIYYYRIYLDKVKEIAIAQYWNEGEEFCNETFQFFVGSNLVTFKEKENNSGYTVSKFNFSQGEPRQNLPQLDYTLSLPKWPLTVNNKRMFALDRFGDLFHCSYNNVDNWKVLKRNTWQPLASCNGGFFADNNLMFIQGMKLVSDESREFHSVLLSTNVFSLQDICFQQLIVSYKKLFPEKTLQEKEICEYFNLPTFLNRKYFGPGWSLDNEH